MTDEIKNGIALEIYDRQLEILKVSSHKYYNQESLDYDVEDYLFQDQEDALNEAKQDFIEEIRLVFGNDKNPALLELERIANNVWEKKNTSGNYARGSAKISRAAEKKRKTRPPHLFDKWGVRGSQKIYQGFEKWLRIFFIGFADFSQHSHPFIF